MDYFTSVSYRLDQQRAADLARDNELLRRRADRGSAVAGQTASEPHTTQPAHRLRGAWARIRAFAHVGHPLAR